ncbi:GNAT family N-acetyltransferase [Aestuariivirga sp.]|uniref:GNAT family N-acetyltransferase n=1 Tax=Aestuariivirga sp. TaxID=2650926 RepID=UPI0035932F1B
MAGELSVRLATEADRVAWSALWQNWQRHMGGQVPADVTMRSWTNMVTPASGIECLLAFDGDAALGFGIVSRTFFAWTGEDILYLQDLFVMPDARGRGAGSALVEGIFAHADAVNASQVFWMVDTDDPGLQGFYDRRATRSPYLRYLRRPWSW